MGPYHEETPKYEIFLKKYFRTCMDVGYYYIFTSFLGHVEIHVKRLQAVISRQLYNSLNNLAYVKMFKNCFLYLKGEFIRTLWFQVPSKRMT